MKKVIFAILIALSVLNVASAQKTVGDWHVSSSSGMIVANTGNSTGSITGVVCFIEKNQCFPYLKIDIDCDDGGKYAMMINSSIGAYHITADCTALGKDKYYFFYEAQNVRSAFESGGEIGMAFPLKSGQFRVIRFSTSGATAAIQEALSLLEIAQKRGGKRKSKDDETL